MISEEEYLKALEIVAEYHKQKGLEDVIKINSNQTTKKDIVEGDLLRVIKIPKYTKRGICSGDIVRFIKRHKNKGNVKYMVHLSGEMSIGGFFHLPAECFEKVSE